MSIFNLLDNSSLDPLALKKDDIIECPYDGSRKAIVLLPGKYQLECWGAQGGTCNASYATGGPGGYSKGTLNLDKATILYLYAGGQGSYGTSTTFTTKNGGGFNGGGGASYYGGGGGGATDIRIGQDSLYARVIVAGGGGGAYAYNNTYKAAGGAGGGTSGVDGSYYSYTNFTGKGGTQTAGGASNAGVTSGTYNGEAGSFGVGGASGRAYSQSYYSNGAGGGGWYGGSGADCYSSTTSNRNRAAGGGGGSGYVFNINTAGNYPSGCLLNYSYYLDNSETLAGNQSFTDYSGNTVVGHSGNGAIKITIKELKPFLKKIYLKINADTWIQLFENAVNNLTIPKICNVSISFNEDSYGLNGYYARINGIEYNGGYEQETSFPNLTTDQNIILRVVACQYTGVAGNVILNGTTIYTNSTATAEEYSWDPSGYQNVEIFFTSNNYMDTQIIIIAT